MEVFIEIVKGIVLICILFGLSIFVHELGHFLVARWCGLKIDAFSIGFGPALFKRTVGGVVYKIGLLPLGGYVALPQMDPTGGIEDKDKDGASDRETLPRISPGKKILVAVAGATMNMLFALLLAFMVWKVGKPAQPTELYSYIGQVAEDSQAYEKGLRIGDQVLEVNGEAVKSWQDVSFLVSLKKDEVELKVLNTEGQEERITLDTKPLMMDIRAIPGLAGMTYCRVYEVDRGLSAKQVGILPNDLIVKAAGQKLYSTQQLSDIVQGYDGKELEIEVKRNNKTMLFNVYPEETATDIPGYGTITKVRFGVTFNPYDFDLDNLVHPTPMSQMKYFATTIFRILKALTSPGEFRQAAGGLSGPIGIFYMIWVFKASWGLAFWFTALLNVNLAILNMLPLPVLDGGHVTFSFWELITQRPVSAKLVVGLSQLFMFLLLLVVILLSYKDFKRFVMPHFAQDPVAVAEEVPGDPPPEVDPVP